jgi:hypothetical protein
MMDISDDDRVNNFHKRASELLRKWEIMQRDMESTVLRVKLDRNRFSTPWDLLRSTKEVGFLLALCLTSAWDVLRSFIT